MICSCGRGQTEFGNELCRFCREDWEREQEERLDADRVAEAREQEEYDPPDEDFYIRGVAL